MRTKKIKRPCKNNKTLISKSPQRHQNPQPPQDSQTHFPNLTTRKPLNVLSDLVTDPKAMET